MLKRFSIYISLFFLIMTTEQSNAQADTKWPAIFYSPHQDDEALGMAGAILEHKAAGRPVWLVLVMDGANDGLLQMMNGMIDCSVPALHGSSGPIRHTYNLTMEQLAWARKLEFIASAKVLGVDKIFIAEDGQGLHTPSSASEESAFVERIKAIILKFEERAMNEYGVPASHKFITAQHDLIYPDRRVTYDHAMIERAAQELRHDNILRDVRFYRVNVYSNPVLSVSDYFPELIIPLSSAQMDSKRQALDEYKKFIPLAGRYALGFHSIGYTLFENSTGAYYHANEYLDCDPDGC